MQNIEELIRRGLKKGAKGLPGRLAGYPAELELSRYLEGILSPEKRQNIEKHLADCSYCLDLLVATKEILKNEPQAKTSRLKMLGKQKWLILTTKEKRREIAEIILSAYRQ
jgi:predicted anti-sigma-YlaC factor YlaD